MQRQNGVVVFKAINSNLESRISLAAKVLSNPPEIKAIAFILIHYAKIKDRANDQTSQDHNQYSLNQIFHPQLFE